MNRFLIVIVLFLFSPVFISLYAVESTGHESGTPFIRNYPPREYRAFSQNWGIAQDNRGLMYVANGDGVLEYDGVNWRLIRTKGNYTVSAMATDKAGRIFVGSINEFGYLAPDEKGFMAYYSLMEKVDTTNFQPGFIYSIFVKSESELIITAANAIFKFSYIDDKFKITEYPDAFNIFKVNEAFYTWNPDYGLGFLLNDSVVSIPGGDFFQKRSVQTILDYDNKHLLVSTRRDGFFLVNKSDAHNFYKPLVATPFPTQIDDFLIKNRYNTSLKLKNGTFAFATSRSGTVIIDKTGRIIQLLNKNNGIYNDTHYAIFQDAEDAIWLALDNGISKAETNSPITFWNDATGLKGSVLSAIRYKGVLYAATWQGVFYLDTNRIKNTGADNNLDVLLFKPVKGIYSTCWDFLRVEAITGNPMLLAATTDGVYSIENDSAFLINSLQANRLLRPRKNPDYILAGLENGAAFFKIIVTPQQKVSFGEPEVFQSINQRVISLGETASGDIWLGTQYSGLVHLQENFNRNDSIVKNYTPSFFATYKNATINGSVFMGSYRGKLLFAAENGLFYITKLNTMKPFSQVLNRILSNRGVITVFKEDNRGCLWIQATQKLNGEKILLCVETKPDGHKVFRSIPFKPIPKAEIWNFYPEHDGTIWFCNDEGLFRFVGSADYSYQKEFNTLLRRVTLENDSVIFGGANPAFEHPFVAQEQLAVENEEEQSEVLIDNKYNSVVFEFASLYFYDETQNKYKYFLEGFDKKWSDWTPETKKEYTNLPSGSYIFRVISRNIFEEDGAEAVYVFRVSKPWYTSLWVYAIFILVIACIVYLIVKFNNKKLVAQKVTLENMVQERTSEIIKQKREIEIEKEKSDRLLLNILPFKIAEELKEKGFAKAKYYESVSVLFADFTGFTQIAEKMEPEELIKELNKCFVFFDEVCVRHNVEKIKTVGDSYMCAGGVPIRNNTHPVDIILAALEMVDFIKKLQAEQTQKGETPWQLRIGIHTGEVIAGVVGKKKFAYDIWGDTVNTASRLETTSEPDKVNISGATYFLVKDFFVSEYRGKVAAKHKGEVDMNFVYRIKPELSHDDYGFIPNLKFKEMYNQLIKEL